MPLSPAGEPRTSDEVNADMRRLSAGRVLPSHWSPAELAELARLRAEWQRAVERERKQEQELAA